MNVVNVQRHSFECCLVPSCVIKVLSCSFQYSCIVLEPGQLPAVLTAVVNVVNGSFRADAASSLIVTRGFMGNLPVNFSGSSPLEYY